MLLRENLEQREKEWLRPEASKAAESRGRREREKECPYRTVFQRDRDRIIHSKAFRRLMHKTQVFLSPEGDHYRTRLTHTLEVSQVARTLARALNLARRTVRVLYENIALAVGTVALLLAGLFAGSVHMSAGMLIHEASILAVILNAMRLLIPSRKKKERKP